MPDVRHDEHRGRKLAMGDGIMIIDEKAIIGLMNDATANIQTHKKKGDEAGNDFEKLSHQLQVQFWMGYMNALETVQLLMKVK
jgi:hypothetical protein